MKKLLMIAAMVAVIGMGGLADAARLDLTAAPCAASSTGWSLLPSYAFDQVINSSSRWSCLAHMLPDDPTAPPGNHEWIRVDMGQDYLLTVVAVNFQAGSAVDYTVRLMTEEDGLTLSLNDRDNYRIIATAVDLDPDMGGPRGFEGSADYYRFTDGFVNIAGGPPPGTAVVDELDPVGRYLMIDATECADDYYGNVSIYEIEVDGDVPPTIPEPAGLGLVGIALLAMRRRRS